MLRRRARGQAGFVITLELVLIFSILGIGLLVGLVAIRNALFKWWVNKQAQTVWVYDSSDPAKVLGPVRDFDEHEAPRLFYIDRNVTWEDSLTGEVTANFRAFIGVRDDRFTGRQRVFYTELGCTGTPCLPAMSNEDADNLGIGTLSVNIDTNGDSIADTSTTSKLQNAGGVGYLYALQRGPTYGIGADIDQTFGGYRLPGTLYRQTPAECLGSGESIHSVWTSQEVVSGEPCLNLPEAIQIESAKCPSGQQGDELGEPCNVSPNVDPRCVTGGTCSGGPKNGLSCYLDSQCAGFSCNVTPLICACPVGWSKGSGANCCPPGSIETAPGQCTIGTLTGVFFEATPVLDPTGNANAFAAFTPPFRVNLPPDTSSFVSTPPTGENP